MSTGPFPPRRVSWVTARCEAQGEKPKTFPFHPGVVDEGKAGRVNPSEWWYLG